MHILLPPSETKRVGGEPHTTRYAHPHTPSLDEARISVRNALDTLMGDAHAAASALKLGVRSHSELQHNRELDSPLVLPAIERYTGVLYDALSVETLPSNARDWLDSHVSVQSALFGLISADSLIPAYRLSAGTRLPSMGHSLKKVWSAAHAQIDWTKFGWVLDLRSKDYVALAPLPSGSGVFVDVKQRDASGKLRSLNHFNKAAKGRLVRQLAIAEPHIRHIADFREWAQAEHIETHYSADSDVLDLIFPADEK